MQHLISHTHTRYKNKTLTRSVIVSVFCLPCSHHDLGDSTGNWGSVFVCVCVCLCVRVLSEIVYVVVFCHVSMLPHTKPWKFKRKHIYRLKKRSDRSLSEPRGNVPSAHWLDGFKRKTRSWKTTTLVLLFPTFLLCWSVRLNYCFCKWSLVFLRRTSSLKSPTCAASN